MYSIKKYLEENFLIKKLLKNKIIVKEIILEENIFNLKGKYKKIRTILENKRISKIKDDKHEEVFIKPFYLFLFLLCFIFFSYSTTMFYIDDVKKTINIVAAIFIIVIIPLFLLLFNLFIQLFSLSKKNFIPFLYGFIKNFQIDENLKAILVSYRMFFYLSLNIVFSSISFLLIFVKSAFSKYNFLIETTWLPQDFIVSIINLCSKILFFLEVPSNELILKTIQTPLSDKLWLWFILSSILVYNIILRILIFPLTFLYSKKCLKNIFLNSTLVKEFLSIRPEIYTTLRKQESKGFKENKKIISKIAKKHLEEIILYKLNEKQLENIVKNLEKNKVLQNIKITFYNRKMEFEKIKDSVLIVVDKQIDLKRNIVNKIYDDKRYIELTFVDENGIFSSNELLIKSWEEFFSANSLDIKVKNYG